MKNLRQEFADTMLEIGKNDRNLVVMVGDISHGILQPFAKKYKGRYFNIGICEPSMINLAAGFSKVGLNPVVHTIAPFITERSFEQIKLDFGYQKESMNLISVGGSFDYSQLGCSHHCYTDVSLLSHINRSNVIIPGSPIELNTIFKKIYKKKYINYFRLTENPHGIDFSRSDIAFGKGIKIRSGKDITIATIAPQLQSVIKASKKLLSYGISVEIIYFHTFKPFDSKLLKSSVNKTKKLLSVEELSAHDGLFNQCLKSVIEIDGLSCKQLAVNDFISGYGTHQDMMETAGISEKHIINAAKKIVTKKR